MTSAIRLCTLEELCEDNTSLWIIQHWRKRTQRKRRIRWVKLRHTLYRQLLDEEEWLVKLHEIQFYRLFRMARSTFEEVSRALLQKDEFGLKAGLSKTLSQTLMPTQKFLEGKYIVAFIKYAAAVNAAQKLSKWNLCVATRTASASAAALALDKPALIQKNYHGGNHPIPHRTCLLVFLRYMGSQETLTSIAERFKLSESTAMHIINNVLYIFTCLKKRYIVWPQTVEEFEFIANGFPQYPGVIGAIDGSHVDIKVPAAQHDSYVDRFMKHSINLMAVCNADRVFTYVFAGFPGSAHDARVLDNSLLVQNIERFGPAQYFLDVTKYHIIGDSAFPLRQWLMKPYKMPQNAIQRRHNYRLSSARVVIENIFGIVKGRWARLQFINTYAVAKAIEITTVACILHNFCLLHTDEWHDDVIDDRIENIRQEDDRDDAHAQLKRDRIAHALFYE